MKKIQQHIQKILGHQLQKLNRIASNKK